MCQEWSGVIFILLCVSHEGGGTDGRDCPELLEGQWSVSCTGTSAESLPCVLYCIVKVDG